MRNRVHPLAVAESNLNPVILAICQVGIRDLIKREKELCRALDELADKMGTERISATIDTSAIAETIIPLLTDTFGGRTISPYCELFHGETGFGGIRTGPCTGCPYQHENTCKIATLESYSERKAKGLTDWRERGELTHLVKALRPLGHKSGPATTLLQTTFGTGFRGDGMARLHGAKHFNYSWGITVPDYTKEGYTFFRTKDDGFGQAGFYGWIKDEEWDEFSGQYGDAVSTSPTIFEFILNKKNQQSEWVGKDNSLPKS